jgi:ribosome-associated protein
MSEFDYTPPEEERPSKSHRKREMIALQKLGEALVNLPEAQLDNIPLDEKLFDAITMARSITNFEGKRRQMQYIGRLMRDADVKPIEEALARFQLKHQNSTAQFHQTERWRDKLMAEGDEKIQEFILAFPDTDRQRLRQLTRNAKLLKSGADTELFRYIRQMIEKSL